MNIAPKSVKAYLAGNELDYHYFSKKLNQHYQTISNWHRQGHKVIDTETHIYIVPASMIIKK